MIIGYNYFSRGFHSNVFDTAIPTSHIDEVVVGAGIYDEIFVSVDTTIEDDKKKPTSWQLKTIMNPSFEGDLEAGSIESDGHKIRNIQIYRRKYLTNESWLLVSQFPYSIDYNVYSFIDRFTENGATYEYAIVPLAKDVLGEITLSEPVDVEYNGVFLTDLENNYQMEVDFEMGTVDHNNNVSTSNPLNGRFPIVTYGNQNYRTGEIDFLPLTQQQKDTGGMKIDGRDERMYQEKVLGFLKNSQAKVVRNDNGDMMVVAAHDVSTTSKNGNLLDLNAISFSFTEIGELDFETMSKAGLIGSAGASKYTFDENGNIVWALNYLDETEDVRREFRNSPPKRVRDDRDNRPKRL